MTDLADFLLARIAEDKEAAREAQRNVDSVPVGATIFHRADLDHIARWDPARVLTECEAKRGIVKALAARGPDAGLTSAEDRGAAWALRESCKALALPYVDHPDYRQEWKP